MSDGGRRRRRLWSGAGLVLVPGAVLLLWGFGAGHSPKSEKAPDHRATHEPPTSRLDARGQPEVARDLATRPDSGVRSLVPEGPGSAAPLQLPPGLEVVGAAPHAPHEPGMVPHPLDEARARIASENRLIQSLNDAMSFRRVTEMRELLRVYRELDPRDVEAHQRGYQVIADCLEFPGAPSLRAARAFYEVERHSPLRRFVRRLCFENGK